MDAPLHEQIAREQGGAGEASRAGEEPEATPAEATPAKKSGARVGTTRAELGEAARRYREAGQRGEDRMHLFRGGGEPERVTGAEVEARLAEVFAEEGVRLSIEARVVQQ